MDDIPACLGGQTLKLNLLLLLIIITLTLEPGQTKIPAALLTIHERGTNPGDKNKEDEDKYSREYKQKDTRYNTTKNH